MGDCLVCGRRIIFYSGVYNKMDLLHNKKEIVMEKYISLNALLAEINRQQRRLCLLGQSNEIELRKSAAIQNGVYYSILSFIDTLEVKEVDLDKERMSECPYREVGCTMYEDKVLKCEGACSWVVDYHKLKELKAQKGE